MGRLYLCNVFSFFLNTLIIPDVWWVFVLFWDTTCICMKRFSLVFTSKNSFRVQRLKVLHSYIWPSHLVISMNTNISCTYHVCIMWCLMFNYQIQTSFPFKFQGLMFLQDHFLFSKFRPVRPTSSKSHGESTPSRAKTTCATMLAETVKLRPSR